VIVLAIDPFDAFAVAFTLFFGLLSWKSGYIAMMMESANQNPWLAPKVFHYPDFAEPAEPIATDDTRLK
jgi:hypothetical protein